MRIKLSFKEILNKNNSSRKPEQRLIMIVEPLAVYSFSTFYTHNFTYRIETKTFRSDGENDTLKLLSKDHNGLGSGRIRID